MNFVSNVVVVFSELSKQEPGRGNLKQAPR